MSTDSVQLERRCGQRFRSHIPLALHVEGRGIPGYAQDVSGRGLFLYADTSVREGTVVELTFTMPSEITLGESMRVRARGRVLRTASSLSGATCGIAVQLDSYQYLPSLECEVAPAIARVSAADSVEERSGVPPR